MVEGKLLYKLTYGQIEYKSYSIWEAVWRVIFMYGFEVAGKIVRKDLTITSSYPEIEVDFKGLVVR